MALPHRYTLLQRGNRPARSGAGAEFLEDVGRGSSLWPGIGFRSQCAGRSTRRQTSQTLREAQRVLRPNGLLVHCIDFSDHSAHSDPSITLVNFLQYDEAAWARLAGNRFAFHNRLRVDEFAALVDGSGVTTIALDSAPDAWSIAALEAGLPLAARFRGKPPQINGVKQAWLIGR